MCFGAEMMMMMEVQVFRLAYGGKKVCERFDGTGRKVINKSRCLKEMWL